MSGKCLSLQLLEGDWVNIQNALGKKQTKKNPKQKTNSVLKHNDVI